MLNLRESTYVFFFSEKYILVLHLIFNVLFVLGQCPMGTYSTTGYSKSGCIPCPSHFYQYLTAQTMCEECPMNQKTVGIGSSSSSACLPVEERKMLT